MNLELNKFKRSHNLNYLCIFWHKSYSLDMILNKILSTLWTKRFMSPKKIDREKN